MKYTNITNLKEFVISGFPGLPHEYYGPVSVLLLLVFLAIVIGNVFVSVIIACEPSLHKPVYLLFFLLAMTDLGFGIVILPSTIASYWWNDFIVSFRSCFAQLYFVHSLETLHALLLLMMALDRTVAIWFPFQYPVLFTNKRVSIGCFLCLLITQSVVIAMLVRALSVPYCDLNVIMQCYCDHGSIIRLACGERVAYVRKNSSSSALVILLIPLAFIIVSYFSIITVVMRMSQVENRHKVLATCTPQLLIICLHFVPRVFVVIANNTGLHFNFLLRIIITMTYRVIPAAVNPLIYCLKTADIKKALILRFIKKKNTHNNLKK